MGKFSGRTKNTYSKYSKPESNQCFRQRLKKPCPKFEDLFIDKKINEDLFPSSFINEPQKKSSNLNLVDSIFSSSGNDTFDAIVKPKNVKNENNIKCKIIKSPDTPSTSDAELNSDSSDIAFLSALQSPFNDKELQVSSPSTISSEKKLIHDIVQKNCIVTKDIPRVMVPELKKNIFEENKNLTENSIFNIITSTPAVNNTKGKYHERMNILNEISPVSKNSSFDNVEDSYISETDIKLLNDVIAEQIKSAEAPIGKLGDLNLFANVDLKTDYKKTLFSNNSSDIVYSDEDILYSESISQILSLKPTTLFRITRRRKCREGNIEVNEKFNYSKLSHLQHSNMTKSFLKKTQNSKVSSYSVLENKNKSTNIAEFSICKGGKGWKRSIKKFSSAHITQALMFSGVSDKESFAVRSNDDYKVEILNLCGHHHELLITDCFTEEMIKTCKKIGEGLYGEVFLVNIEEECKDEEQDQQNVLKLMPIEGSFTVNGEAQKSFEQMLPEVLISKYLSDLHKACAQNTCSSFVRMKRCWCLMGSYTEDMLRLWDVYHHSKGSENDRPNMFPVDQLYLALQYEFAGQDLEAYVFNNGKQAYSAFLQIAYSLCVAELEFHFEHRDLHWGNVLIKNIPESFLEYRVKGHPIKLKTYGVKATIIDFTLSRLSISGKNYYNDVSQDNELFMAEGDYQFEVYRKMRDNNGNEWETFQPKSNIFWLHYLILKIRDHCYYKNKSSKIHKEGMKAVRVAENSILKYESAAEYICDLENIS